MGAASHHSFIHNNYPNTRNAKNFNYYLDFIISYVDNSLIEFQKKIKLPKSPPVASIMKKKANVKNDESIPEHNSNERDYQNYELFEAEFLQNLYCVEKLSGLLFKTCSSSLNMEQPHHTDEKVNNRSQRYFRINSFEIYSIGAENILSFCKSNGIDSDYPLIKKLNDLTLDKRDKIKFSNFQSVKGLSLTLETDICLFRQ